MPMPPMPPMTVVWQGSYDIQVETRTLCGRTIPYAFSREREWPAVQAYRAAVVLARCWFPSTGYLPDSTDRARAVAEGRAQWREPTACMFQGGGR